MKWFRSLAVRSVVTASALLSLAGCGGTGEVSGKVTYNGTALPGGLVTIYDSQNGAKQGLIKDGSYNIPDVAMGPAQICVETSPPIVSGINQKNPPTLPFGPYMPIPAKYKEKKNGIAYEVKKGKQDFDLKLEGTVDTPAGK
jgi:hypothetical protein